MTIVNIQVKRRPLATTNTLSKPLPVDVCNASTDTNLVSSYIPSFMELVYDIYDAQRDIISDIKPKRTQCSIPIPVKQIERLFHGNPNLVRFDGMSHSQATLRFKDQAVRIGIRNDFCIPFIFADKITIRSHSFREGFAFTFEKINGMRYQTLSTQPEFFWLSSNRQILSNLSFYLNQKYNCNLHIASDEANRIYYSTGETVTHNRHLFTRACDYYINPRLLSLDWFVRAQVKELRNVSDDVLWDILNDTDSLISTDPILAYAVDKAKGIYHGKIDQWVGDFSHEKPAQ